MGLPEWAAHPLRDQIENAGGPFGQWARAAALVAILLALVSLARRTLLRRLLAARHLARMRRWGDALHLAAGFATLGIALVHAWFAPSLNPLIWAGMACLSLLVALGIALQWRLVGALNRRPGATRAAKWALTLAGAVLIVWGHAQLPPPAWAALGRGP